jgi:type IV pilus biogenesis protein CpaD/CtpE
MRQWIAKPLMMFSLVMIAAGAVAGCSVEARQSGHPTPDEVRQQQDIKIRAENNAQARSIAQECGAQMASHDLDPIRGKVELARPENTEGPAFAILTNDRIPTGSDAIPTGEERAAIAKWATIRDSCIQRINQFWASAPYPPSGGPLYRQKYFSFSDQARE